MTQNFAPQRPGDIYGGYPCPPKHQSIFSVNVGTVLLGGLIFHGIYILCKIAAEVAIEEKVNRRLDKIEKELKKKS